jgi:hypothetical protein
MPDASIDIANQALLRLGQTPITAFGESQIATAAGLLYGPTRDKLLTWNLWPWTMCRQVLSRLAAAPASGYDYQYGLPSLPAVLRLLDIDSAGVAYRREIYPDPVDPHVQLGVILTDASSVVLQYQGRTSEAVWPPLFADTLALWLALELAPVVSGQSRLRETLAQTLQLQLAKLISIAGHEDSPRSIVLDSTYLDVR